MEGAIYLSQVAGKDDQNTAPVHGARIYYTETPLSSTRFIYNICVSSEVVPRFWTSRVTNCRSLSLSSSGAGQRQQLQGRIESYSSIFSVQPPTLSATSCVLKRPSNTF